MLLEKVKSDIDDLVSLMAEHRLHNRGDKLTYGLIESGEVWYFIDIKSDLINTDNYKHKIICPYCKQKLIFIKGYTRNDEVTVTSHLKHEASNPNNKDCIFNNLCNPNHERDRHRFYARRDFSISTILVQLPHTPFKLSIPRDYRITPKPYSIKYSYKDCEIEGYIKDYKVDDINVDVLFKTSDGYLGFILNPGEHEVEVCKSKGLRLVDFYESEPSDLNRIICETLEIGDLKYRVCLNEITVRAQQEFTELLEKQALTQDINIVEKQIYHSLKVTYGMHKVKKGKGYDWITKHGEICDLNWVNIKVGNKFINRKLPQVAINKFRELGYKVNFGYKN